MCTIYEGFIAKSRTWYKQRLEDEIVGYSTPNIPSEALARGTRQDKRIGYILQPFYDSMKIQRFHHGVNNIRKDECECRSFKGFIREL